MSYLRCFLTVALAGLLMLGSAGCSEDKEIYGLWNISCTKRGPEVAEIAAYLDLRKDNTYTMCLPNYFDYGHWNYNATSVLLMSNRKDALYEKRWEIVLNDRDADSIKVTLPFASRVSQKQFKGGTLPLDKIRYTMCRHSYLLRSKLTFANDKDPYSIEYSRWRIPPAHPESRAELKSRILQYFDHILLLCQHQLDAGDDDWSMQFSPGPFIFASNGVGMTTIPEMDDNWCSVFFNQENAQQAWYIIAELFKTPMKMPATTVEPGKFWITILTQARSRLVAMNVNAVRIPVTMAETSR